MQQDVISVLRFHYLMPDHESCVDDCSYYLAKDHQLMESVNCKTRYNE